MTVVNGTSLGRPSPCSGLTMVDMMMMMMMMMLGGLKIGGMWEVGLAGGGLSKWWEIGGLDGRTDGDSGGVTGGDERDKQQKLAFE